MEKGHKTKWYEEVWYDSPGEEKTPVNKRVSRNLKNSHLEDDFFGLVSKYLLTAYYISC